MDALNAVTTCYPVAMTFEELHQQFRRDDVLRRRRLGPAGRIAERRLIAERLTDAVFRHPEDRDLAIWRSQALTLIAIDS